MTTHRGDVTPLAHQNEDACSIQSDTKGAGRGSEQRKIRRDEEHSELAGREVNLTGASAFVVPFSSSLHFFTR